MQIFKVEMQIGNGVSFDVYVTTSSFQVAQQKAEQAYPEARTLAMSIERFTAKLITE